MITVSHLREGVSLQMITISAGAGHRAVSLHRDCVLVLNLAKSKILVPKSSTYFLESFQDRLEPKLFFA